MLHRCIEGERVGVGSGEVVGVDLRHDEGLSGVPVPSGERGRERPFLFFFFLDLPPRWEKGFPSGPWPPWHGMGERPFEIGSVSFLSVSAFPDSALSPFLKFSEIRNSGWVILWTRFLS